MLKRLVAAAILVLPLFTQAAVVTSVFTPLGGSKWSVDLDISNDDSAIPVSEFSVFFPQASFANVLLTASPSHWDTIVVQRDLGLPAPGFVDGLALDLAHSLEQGESIGGFRLIFDRLDLNASFELPFEVYDAEFNLLEAGTTIATVTDPGGGTVSEPSVLWLSLFGLALIIALPRFGVLIGRDGIQHVLLNNA
jgi:hypothetical protein